MMSELNENIRRLTFSLSLGESHWKKVYIDNMKSRIESLKAERKKLGSK